MLEHCYLHKNQSLLPVIAFYFVFITGTLDCALEIRMAHSKTPTNDLSAMYCRTATEGKSEILQTIIELGSKRYQSG